MSIFRMKKNLFVLAAVFLFIRSANAQIPDNLNASDILLGMKKLQVLGSVLYVAAHPDDENTRLLAWLAKDKLYRTGYLSLTRGDGGQNLIGDEQGIELGLIRTQELLAARQVDGADQFFSRAYDFGFSKTTAEALTIWNEQKILSDVVWVIRNFQPDIIITRFPEDKRAGHGQHSASAVLARLAFKAAADPRQFPEQFAYGVHPWQATRLLLNTYRFGSINTTSEDQMKIEVGGYNPLVGKSYGEIAADSRSQHRSQGFGVPHSRGSQLEYFSLTEGEKADSSLMQRIDCSWNRLPRGAPIGEMIEKMVQQYEPSAPYRSLQELLAIYKSIKALPAGYWRDKKLKETQVLIQACSGLYLEATVPGAYALQDQTIPVTLQIVNRSPVSVSLNSVSMNGQDSGWNQVLNPGINYTAVRNISLQGLPVSQPYWLVEPMSPGSYNVQEQTLIGEPWNPSPVGAVFNISFSGETFLFRQRIFYKSTDPVKGEIYQPLTIVPRQMAYCDPALLVFTKGEEQDLSVINQQKPTIPPVLENLTVHPASVTQNLSLLPDISLTPVNGFESREISKAGSKDFFRLKSGETKDLNHIAWVVRVQNNMTDTLQQCRTISYEHIPRIDYFKPAATTVVSVNLKTAGSRIGYIEGAGDKVPDALTAMGYTVIKLSEDNINPLELKNLDAIITGLRAYDVQKWLAGKYAVLMDYVYNGGNLIVQYNRNRGADTTGIGPWPFGISNARVSEEDAPVRFLQPEHPVLHFPNEITAKDFDGWVQERGIYFAQHTDPKYASVLTMHDTGEPDQNGSLITGNYGKGNFTYTGLVFFRELPAGIPGAYRLFANLIALNQHKKK
jgi:LmbE family N-acetylglucosaminyl deacetylase